MFEGLEFDELNTLTSTRKAMPFDRYFGEMDLTKEQTDERISLAGELHDGFLFVLALVFTMAQYMDSVNWTYIELEFQAVYQQILNGHITSDAYITSYVNNFAREVTQSTRDNLSEEDPYYLTDDRAMFMAENEAESIEEYEDFASAINAGCTMKQWVDIRDNRERETHRQVGGTIIPIDEVFEVGDSLMYFPKDESFDPDPDEVVNCRCHCEYF